MFRGNADYGVTFFFFFLDDLEPPASSIRSEKIVNTIKGFIYCDLV